MEGVGDDGRLFLLERPSPEALQNKLWMLYLDAEQKRDELKSQLKYKVEQLTRKEEGLIEWQDALAIKEVKIESGKDSLCNMMRELHMKDMLLVDKEIEIKKKDREIEDHLRQCKEDVRREVEVGCCVLCCFIIVLLRIIEGSMGVRKDHMMTGGRCVYYYNVVFSVNVLFFIRMDIGKVLNLDVKETALGRLT